MREGISEPRPMSGKRVILLSPNPFGDYSICVADLLARQGITIAPIFVTKLLDFRRLRREITQEGPTFFARKVARKLLLKRHIGAEVAYETMGEYKLRKG
jgi:hypothetical protein